MLGIPFTSLKQPTNGYKKYNISHYTSIFFQMQ
jgi:hypothetical protein